VTRAPSLELSLRQAKDWLRDRVDDGDRCPCCGQFAKVYRRQIHSTMARALIKVYTVSEPGEFVHLARIAGPACEGGKARYWGLVEEESSVVTEGRSGYWRLTQLGRAFVQGRSSVPQYAFIYDSRCLRTGGPLVTIHHCLGKKFDYAELMSPLP
jgi:hypothetical protein